MNSKVFLIHIFYKENENFRFFDKIGRFSLFVSIDGGLEEKEKLN